MSSIDANEAGTTQDPVHAEPRRKRVLMSDTESQTCASSRQWTAAASVVLTGS
ncbi:MAG: hypothetical protein R3C97_02600 [Geminicoccaceae bacterium]